LIRTKIIRSFTYGYYYNWIFTKKFTMIQDVMELDRFIAEVGYENIKQILVNGEPLGGTRYTVLYEDGLDTLPPHKLCPRCHSRLEPFDTTCKYCRLQNIY
jgi:hypothetical protein